jgi:hypothetical protein
MLLRLERPPSSIAVRIAELAVAAEFKFRFENPASGSPDPSDAR